LARTSFFEQKIGRGKKEKQRRETKADLEEVGFERGEKNMRIKTWFGTIGKYRKGREGRVKTKNPLRKSGKGGGMVVKKHHGNPGWEL